MSRETRVARVPGVDDPAPGPGTIRTAGPGAFEGPRPCLWMSAGLVSYKLCDRGFDCERCPLDAALRGEPLAVPGAPPADTPRVAALSFPEDRLYGDGHTWIKEGVMEGVREEAGGAGCVLRIGLDAFAVALIGGARRIEPRVECGSEGGGGGAVDEGEPLCDLDLGIGHLAVRSPVRGVARRWNDALVADAALLVTEPYGAGWLVELAPAGQATSGGEGLCHLHPAGVARDRARLDLRRFRRRAALFLFDQTDTVGPTLQDGGEVLTDLRCILGPTRFVELIGELIC